MIERVLKWLDERLGTAHFVNKALRKAFPDHWSFMLGEINLDCFLILVLTGTFLALFFSASSSPTIYAGPYTLLDGASMSQAYASVLYVSFEVNGGMLVRQIHHWTALVFIAGIVVHMARIFFTGAFRKPREINWIVGLVLFQLALLAGFTGYSLPDDLLSGTGLRIADSVLLSVPVVGTWASFLLLGGAFPSSAMIPRLFVTHVYILPAAIAAVIGLHLAIVWRQKHTQFPGPGHTEHNVVGSPLFPKYAAKSLALLCATGGVVAALAAFVQINPIWIYGPYQPWEVLDPAQPDWYVGWIDGALRLGPPLALHLWGHTVPSPFWAAVLLPSVLLALVLLWPWIERYVTRDRAAHHLLDFPSHAPLRTSIGVALFAFALGLTLAGSGDVQAKYAHLSITDITNFYRFFCILAPIIGFTVTYACCRDLRARGGVQPSPRVRLRRNAEGGFDEEAIP